MFNWATRNFGWKFLSVVLAALLWLLLHAEPQAALGGLPGLSSHDFILTRTLPVVVDLHGIPPEGYSITSVRSEPAYLRVRGPQHLLVTLDGVPTYPVDVAHLKAERTFTVSARLATPQLSLEGSPEIRVRVVVQQNR